MKADRRSPRRGQPRGPCSSIAAGLWLGGAKPLILIQNTGMLEAGFDPRLADEPQRADRADGRLRGWTRHGVTTDTVATLYRALPDGVGINYYLVENDADSSRIAVAFEEAERTKRPVVVLVGDEYHGFNR